MPALLDAMGQILAEHVERMRKNPSLPRVSVNGLAAAAIKKLVESGKLNTDELDWADLERRVKPYAKTPQYKAMWDMR